MATEEEIEFCREREQQKKLEAEQACEEYGIFSDEYAKASEEYMIAKEELELAESSSEQTEVADGEIGMSYEWYDFYRDKIESVGEFDSDDGAVNIIGLRKSRKT